MTNEVRLTPEFDEWLDSLKDRKAAALVSARIDRLGYGLVGDVKVFDGIASFGSTMAPATGSISAVGAGWSTSCSAAARSGHRTGTSSGPERWRRRSAMTIETTPFDAARYLGDPETQAIFLKDALETGDAGYIAHALGVIVRARGMTQVAREAGLSREALYKALSPTGNPTLTTLLGVLKALDIKLDVSAA